MGRLHLNFIIVLVLIFLTGSEAFTASQTEDMS